GRDTLHVGPGVEIVFAGPFRLYVSGVLDVAGAPGHNTRFTTDPETNPEGWGGIRFTGSQGLSTLSYCTIEYGQATGQEEYGLGGGLFLERATVELDDCTIHGCTEGSGHAVYARNGSQITLNRCELFENGSEIGSGGAICLRDNCTLTARESRFQKNIALYGGVLTADQSTVLLEDCILVKNEAGVYGGAAFTSYATLTVRRCRFLSNHSLGGGAIDARLSTNSIIEDCFFYANAAARNGGEGPGGALALQSGSQDISHCTFVNNADSTGGAIYGGGSLRLKNSIVARQTSGGGVHFPVPGAVARYNCFFENQGGNCTGPQTPANIGIAVHSNVNGDSCDAYYNIVLDPLFDDSSQTGVELTPNSPCINAGDPMTPPDPDGSLPDLGAFRYEPLNAGAARPEFPQSAALLPAYPNPFNPATTLEFELARAGFVSLRVFDLLGRETAVLASGRLTAGHYTMPWHATAAPAGTYFAVLETAGQRHVQKLLLLK
ncbi:MAG: right-handed parallel beta-helix repeat-containing protein, partial [bacterium]|nr:right-handed parallel beta-helix repeat-containing protein [bacterium]